MMVGQVNLQQKIDKYINTDSLPRTLLLEGTEGCGKHLLASIIAEKMNLDLQDITDSLNLETIEEITLKATPHVYLIDSTKISVKEQNIILKFLEEPLKNSYIVILTDNKSKLLNTVLNRCICLTFEKYSEEELSTFLKPKVTLSQVPYVDTPGRLIRFQELPIQAMEQLATKIFTSIGVANYSNVLTIPTKLNFKDNVELFDCDVFFYIMINVANTLYKSNVIPFVVYQLTDEFYNDCSIPHINKLQLFESFLISLKCLFEGVH